ncbi:MAG: SixA phosphatase family protein [Nitritalea sp.]
MKTLLVLRHGEAAPLPASQDEQRPLSPAGIRQLHALKCASGSWQQPIQEVHGSTAIRVQQTAEIVSQHFRTPPPLYTDVSLYLAPPERLLQYITSWPKKLQHVLLIGHNPGLSQLVHTLTGHRLHLETGMLLHLEIPLDDWSAITRSCAHLKGTWHHV